MSVAIFPRNVTIRFNDKGVCHAYEADGTVVPLNRAGYKSGHGCASALRRYYNLGTSWGDDMNLTGVRNPDGEIASRDAEFVNRMVDHELSMEAKPREVARVAARAAERAAEIEADRAAPVPAGTVTADPAPAPVAGPLVATVTRDVTGDAATILAALRANRDGSTETDSTGTVWAATYLENARPAGMSGHVFAGHLSALDRAGLYRTLGDDAFGMVRLESPMVAQPVQQQQANAGAETGPVAASPVSGAIPPGDPSAPVLPTFPAFRRYVCEGDTVEIEVGAFRVVARVYRDDTRDTPWEREDGHGPVTDWTRRDKAPGERVLSSDHGSSRFYDIAEATKLARRDGWRAFADVGRSDLTPGQLAANAVEADFRNLKAWCNDEWFYCGVAVTVWMDEVCLTHEYGNALWGVECNYPGSDNDYLSEVAGELLAEALDDARAVQARIASAE